MVMCDALKVAERTRGSLLRVEDMAEPEEILKEFEAEMLDEIDAIEREFGLNV